MSGEAAADAEEKYTVAGSVNRKRRTVAIGRPWISAGAVVCDSYSWRADVIERRRALDLNFLGGRGPDLSRTMGISNGRPFEVYSCAG